MCSELRSIKAPVSSLSDVYDKLLLLLDIKDRSWKSFRSISKNFTAFKNLMASVQTEKLPENIINEVLPLWKNYNVIRAKLSKFSKGACLLLDWIVHVAEFNVKAEMIISSKKRIPELERMVKHQSKTLSDLASESISIEEIMNKTKEDLEDNIVDCEDCEELSLTSKPYSFVNSECDDKHIFHLTVHRGTASGGILHSGKSLKKGSDLEMLFPNFNSDNLYGEVPVEKNIDIDQPIAYEGRAEAVGCCRMKFFCF